jgi:RNA polymerase sigma-70 factor (ECF subfamily)
VVELARAVAIGRARGASAGLAALPSIEGSPYAEAARGVFLSELGRIEEARRHFAKAMTLARTEPERRLMERRLRSF